MNEKQTDKQTCENCRYYSQHYVKRKTKFRKVCCGDCLFKNFKKRHCDDSCENWQKAPDQKEETVRSVIATLKFSLSKSLQDIALIINNDKEYL